MSTCGVSQHNMGHRKGVLKLSGKPSEKKVGEEKGTETRAIYEF